MWLPRQCQPYPDTGKKDSHSEDKCLKTTEVVFKQKIQYYLHHVGASSTGVFQILDEISLSSNGAFQGLIQSK